MQGALPRHKWNWSKASRNTLEGLTFGRFGYYYTMTIRCFNEFVGYSTVYLTGLPVAQQVWKANPVAPGSEARDFPISDRSDRTDSADSLSSDRTAKLGENNLITPESLSLGLAAVHLQKLFLDSVGLVPFSNFREWTR
ncbi:hypothetical protein N7501_005165 [Penicillium viridicatum]|nr:hypothetical protein N7501_005165 [Penicillium viridicatum]